MLAVVGALAIFVTALLPTLEGFGLQSLLILTFRDVA
jgi:hypothetical protein